MPVAVNLCRRLLPFVLLVALGPARALAADGMIDPSRLTERQAFADTVSPDGSVRLAATTALGRIWTLAARDRLMQMAYLDGDPRVRASAIGVLAATRDPDLTPLFKGIAANDPDPEVRGVAAQASDRVEGYAKRPRVAGGFSLLCPGCGYFYLRQPGRAATYLGATAALVGSSLLLLGGEEPRLDGAGPRREPSNAPLAIPTLSAVQNLWFYGVFASYRDARLRRGDEGYTYPVSREGLTDLVSAPFRPSVLRRPWFWAGLPVLLGAAVGFSALIDEGQPAGPMRTLGDGGGVWFLGRHYGGGAGFLLGETYHASLFLPVGVGEEALFRGAIQAGLTESIGLWPGWLVASAIFGAVHTFNFTEEAGGLKVAARAVPFITATGSYLGLVAIKTGFQLETSVALHFWYDFLLATTAFIFDPDHQPFAVRFGLPF